MRIVSLVPSITETLIDFEENQIVGRTKFCIHPQDKTQYIPIIGGTKKLHIEKIKQLSPDLIIANIEENTREDIEKLQAYFPVWITHIHNLETNVNFLKELGKRLNKESLAEEFIKQTLFVFDNLTLKRHKSAAYIIWNSPLMTVGHDTFIHDIMNRLGFKNIFDKETRYPEISMEELKSADVVLLSTEPFPFNEKHINFFKKELPNTEVLLVDGEAFSWYGTRLLKLKTYYESLNSYAQNDLKQ